MFTPVRSSSGTQSRVPTEPVKRGTHTPGVDSMRAGGTKDIESAPGMNIFVVEAPTLGAEFAHIPTEVDGQAAAEPSDSGLSHNNRLLVGGVGWDPPGRNKDENTASSNNACISMRRREDAVRVWRGDRLLREKESYGRRYKEYRVDL